MTPQAKSLVNRCREYLDSRWKHISAAIESGVFADPLLPDNALLRDRLLSCLKCRTKSYHYVLPTQILAKCIDQRLDGHSLQAAYKKPGAFDARTIAHDVIVPFDQANYGVLGGSVEPYVNNPLRCPAVIRLYRKQQGNKPDWDNLISVLDSVQNAKSAEFTQQAFDQILAELYRLLAEAQVVYSTPNRVSLKQTIDLVAHFTADRSRGERIEAVCAALFRAVAATFGLFDAIRRQKVNAADVASGMGADMECWLGKRVALLVEAKDRTLTRTQLDAKLDVARVKKISEMLFLAEHGIESGDEQRTQDRIRSEFVSGQNIYVSSFADFSTGILILLGEKGRIVFLGYVGNELDSANSSIFHRRAWSQLLKSI